jgi:hypothetical protein
MPLGNITLSIGTSFGWQCGNRMAQAIEGTGIVAQPLAKFKGRKFSTLALSGPISIAPLRRHGAALLEGAQFIQGLVKQVCECANTLRHFPQAGEPESLRLVGNARVR